MNSRWERPAESHGECDVGFDSPAHPLLFYATAHAPFAPMHPLANIAVSASRSAGHVIMRHLRQGNSLGVESKGANDYVTQADRDAETSIIETIRAKYPDHAILAEESGASEGGLENDVEWIIDPIDGTTNFIRGIPHFAISIAARVRGRVEHGVVYDPFKEEMFVASRGHGATLDSRRIRVSGVVQTRKALLATGFAYQRDQGIAAHWGSFTSVLKDCGDIRRGGAAALDLAYVAAGRLDGFWEFGLKPWDMAAGTLLVREAGGIVGDPADQDPLTTGNVLAATPKLYPWLREVTAPATTKANP